MRKIVVYGAPSAVLVQAIEAALQQDPLPTSCRKGGVLLGEQTVVTSRTSAEGDDAIRGNHTTNPNITNWNIRYESTCVCWESAGPR